MVIDFWVNALSKEAAAAFLGKSGFGSVEGFFGVDVKEGMTPLDLVAEMDRVGVDRGVLSTVAVHGGRRQAGLCRRAAPPALSGRFGRPSEPAPAAEHGRPPAGH